MKISIDFDGVICKRQGIPTIRDWESNSEPMEGALDAIVLLKSLGHKVWIFTANHEQDKVRSWLKKNGFPELKITNIKEPAQDYIDDRAIRFTNWQDIRKYFS